MVAYGLSFSHPPNGTVAVICVGESTVNWAGAPLKRTAETAISRAFVAGFRAIMLVSAALALGGAASAWWLIRDAAKPTESRTDSKQNASHQTNVIDDPASHAAPRR